MKPTLSTRRGMTLVELLVVIGIIALLITLMVPIISKVKDQANRTKCQNNARQLMNGITLYAGEYDGSLPFSNWRSLEVSGAPYPQQRGWLYWDGAPAPTDPNFQRYLGHPDNQYTKTFNDPNFVKTGSIYKYLKTVEVYHCPIDQAPWPSGSTRNLASYLMSGAVNSYGSTKVPVSHKLSAFPGNSGILWEVNEADNAWNDGANFSSEGPPFRHGRGGSAAFADGHVEWILQGEFAAETSKKPSRFNVDPLRPGL